MRAILVQNYGSSGTTLLHSLFDSHPQLLTLPGLWGLWYHGAFNAAFPPEQAPDAARVVQFVCGCFDGLVNPANSQNAKWGLDKLGPDRDQFATVDRMIANLFGWLAGFIQDRKAILDGARSVRAREGWVPLFDVSAEKGPIGAEPPMPG